MMEAETKKLFTPVKIGSMEVKNRMVVPAMGTNLALHSGEAGDDLISYYTERAKGGFGLLIMECCAVRYDGRSLINECGLWEDSLIQSYEKLTSAVHANGAKIAVQLRHCGRETEEKYTGGKEVLAPSKVPCPSCQSMPHEMTTEEVYEVAEAFGDAALRSRKAGFDAVELHAAHGYLIAQFLSGHANKRTDEFGGSLYNRMRFLRLVMQNIKDKAGDDYPVIVRISGTEMVTGGRDVQETKAVCQMCEEEGAAALHISISTYGNLAYCIGSTYLAPGYETEAAAAIKRAVHIPVITVGRYTDPEIAEVILRDGSADMVAFGRQSIADPHFPEKVWAGKQEEIIPCISCGQGCIMHLFSDEPISCVINPLNGPESAYTANKAKRPKHILVAGGGPGGLLAAWIMAARGHKVELMEKEDYLGGAFLPAAYPPSKSPIAKMIGFYIRQCKKYGVEIHLKHELTIENIRNIRPDAVVIATGSNNLRPPIKGLDQSPVLNPCDVLLGKSVTGHKVLVAGGGLIGAETADFLAEQGREVTIIEMKSEIAEDLDPYARPMLLKELKEHDVAMIKNAEIQEFLEDGIAYRNLLEREGNIRTLRGFDSVVLALGTKNYNPFGEDLEEIVREVYVIGDAKKAGKVYAATHEAVDVAMKL